MEQLYRKLIKDTYNFAEIKLYEEGVLMLIENHKNNTCFVVDLQAFKKWKTIKRILDDTFAENKICPICNEDCFKTNNVLQYCDICSNKVCSTCVTKLKSCPFCRKNIEHNCTEVMYQAYENNLINHK